MILGQPQSDFGQRHPVTAGTIARRHGVMLGVAQLGVLLSGAAGSGKSTLALTLLSRGHALIADDLVELYRRGPELFGRASPGFEGYLMDAELGVIDVRATFGEQAVRGLQQVDLLVHLVREPSPEHDRDPLAGGWGEDEILGRRLPCLSVDCSRPRNLAVTVECARRQIELRRQGRDSVAAFRRLQRDEADAARRRNSSGAGSDSCN